MSDKQVIETPSPMVPEENHQQKEPISHKPLSAYGPIPEGMSKSQWKKICKKKRFEETKDEFNKKRKLKKLQARERKREKIEAYVSKGLPIPEEMKKQPKKNVNQKDSGIKIIIDCAFDDLMNEKEIASMGSQITRSHAANKRADYYATMVCSSFNKRLKERFDKQIASSNYKNWGHFEFTPEDIDKLEEYKRKNDEEDNLIYLSADTDEALEKLEPGCTYIVGGIVDKNRHKLLCYNKAKELGIKTKRLPIDEYIKISGRRVLTTTHVIQLMLKCFEKDGDWKAAFEEVIPSRKLGTDEGDARDGDTKEVEKSSEELVTTQE
ncbi:related to tRNA (guanine(9)-N1)-methyltransferase [Saccharomycodes ludwigii]|uniref:tRNA (guanine(9)-N1)-methyltransferase n=1 Tax=Saccharomycodes ludwigii TaxID=36035 RepID=A0A376B9A5_9ASCO|nr:hypothetical protein SCDLUD_005089 [Saccharomycodes ludwigii]KAH3898755.1 hypothetical protein SCDLUD_005089 [Saccharomycodes ludwigii]SSD61114.1 related to tRNA (guanine(9)-N1)-methyltransferase [Saccharomycodes ludwigii]